MRLSTLIAKELGRMNDGRMVIGIFQWLLSIAILGEVKEWSFTTQILLFISATFITWFIGFIMDKSTIKDKYRSYLMGKTIKDHSKK